MAAHVSVEARNGGCAPRMPVGGGSQSLDARKAFQKPRERRYGRLYSCSARPAAPPYRGSTMVSGGGSDEPILREVLPCMRSLAADGHPAPWLGWFTNRDYLPGCWQTGQSGNIS